MLRTAENPLQFGLIWGHFEMDEAFGRPRPMTTVYPWGAGEREMQMRF